MRRHRPSSQRGYALLIMLIVLVMGSLYGVVRQANAVQAKGRQATNTAKSLKLAKEALIGYAAMHPSVPGSLPCPDTNNDGSADTSGSSCVAYIGRLPWKQLGLADLRDSDGECLWYALSPVFRNAGTYNSSRSFPGVTALNSTTPGSLAIQNDLGNPITASPVVAIVFAPGAPLAGQDRSTVGSPQCGGNTTASNYLDIGPGSVNNATGNGSGSQFVSAAIGDTFNDKLAYITTAELFWTVDRRVVREIRNNLLNYRNNFGTFPDAASNPNIGTASGISTGSVPWSDIQPPPFISGLTSNAKNGWYSYIAYSKSSPSSAQLALDGKVYALP